MEKFPFTCIQITNGSNEQLETHLVGWMLVTQYFKPKPHWQKILSDKVGKYMRKCFDLHKEMNLYRRVCTVLRRFESSNVEDTGSTQKHYFVEWNQLRGRCPLTTRRLRHEGRCLVRTDPIEIQFNSLVGFAPLLRNGVQKSKGSIFNG